MLLLMTLRRKLGKMSYTILPDLAELWHFALPEELVEVLDKDKVNFSGGVTVHYVRRGGVLMFNRGSI